MYGKNGDCCAKVCMRSLTSNFCHDIPGNTLLCDAPPHVVLHDLKREEDYLQQGRDLESKLVLEVESDRCEYVGEPLIHHRIIHIFGYHSTKSDIMLQK